MIVMVNLFGIIVFGAIVFLIARKIKDSVLEDSDRKINALRSEWSDTLAKNTDLILKQLNSMNNVVGARLDNAARVFGEVKESIGALDQKSQQIYEVGRDIASLQEILRAPKMRGGLGELFLEALLNEIMPSKDLYELQYCFKSGERVDAVVKIGERLVPIDAKFPLESFKRFVDAENDEDKKRAKREFARAVKEHINSIAKKYIVPDEKTYDFALMYIPAENVYYEAIIKDEDFAEERSIFSHAMAKKVIPVSPNSFYAYLQVIILGIRGLNIEKTAQDVMKNIAALRGGLSMFVEDFCVIGTHIDNIKSSYERAEKRLDKFGNKLSKIDGVEEERQIEALE